MTEVASKLRLIVHGGAGSTPDAERPIQMKGLQAALANGWAMLQGGAPALSAVVAAIEVLENDPAFDAGYGSVLRLDGSIAMDASIMEGGCRQAGAVAGVSTCPNPIRLAQAVLEETPYVLLIGDEAEKLGKEQGLCCCDPQSLITQRESERLERILAGDRTEESQGPRGTVGAIAVDHNGVMVAGTSTGGTPGSRRGRVGDTPIIGAGTFADNRKGGVSCTGEGEAIMQVLLAHTVAQQLEKGLPADAAAQWGVDFLERETGAECGLICVSPSGDMGSAYNTKWMGVAQRLG